MTWAEIPCQSGTPTPVETTTCPPGTPVGITWVLQGIPREITGRQGSLYIKFPCFV